MRKRIGGAKFVARCEEEQRCADAVGDMQFSQRLHHRLRAVMVGGNRQHPERLPSEFPLVLFSGKAAHIAVLVGAFFAIKPAQAMPIGDLGIASPIRPALALPQAGERGAEVHLRHRPVERHPRVAASVSVARLTFPRARTAPTSMSDLRGKVAVVTVVP